MRRPRSKLTGSLVTLIALFGIVDLARANTLWIGVCGTWTRNAGVMRAIKGHGFAVSLTTGCPKSGLTILARGRSSSGNRAAWQTNAPAGIEIVRAWIPAADLYELGVNAGKGFGGGFYWKGGSTPVHNWDSWTSPSFRSPYFGWQVVCRARACNGQAADAQLIVWGIQLQAEENRSPTITSPATSLFSHSGWVRGPWPVSFHAADPSGVCLTQILVGGQTLYGPAAAADHRTWHQCPDPTFAQTLNTGDYVLNGAGSFPITLRAMNAAGVWTSTPAYTHTIHVDNIPPKLTVVGPTDAPSTAGTQYLDVTASAGPSGVSGISCSLDSAPPRLYPAAAARVPVQGVGVHRLVCVATNNAANATGDVAASAPVIRTLSIRQPTVSTVSFARIANALRCAKRRERVHIPAQWVIEHINGHRVRVHVPAQTRTVTVTRCHPRVIKKRVKVGHKWVLKRVVVLPRRVLVNVKRVRYGTGTTVSGWLGTAQGRALPGQRVEILTAPDDGHQHFSLAATTVTSGDGMWRAHLGPGPSRIVRAVYLGGSIVEPAISTAAHLVVPASVQLSISPRRTHWGDTIKINGRVRGGYIPPAGELVVFRIGWHGGSAEVGHLYTRRDGTFASTYTFLRGNGTETYRLWAETAHETDYPFAPGRSKAATVTVAP